LLKSGHLTGGEIGAHCDVVGEAKYLEVAGSFFSPSYNLVTIFLAESLKVTDSKSGAYKK